MLDFTRLDEVRRRRPLIHCVSNIVTANDCANLALAVGASPMMAQAPEEMEAISAVSDVTVLNTGTPDAEKFRACRICAASARHPVVLDPVGVGASPLRTSTAHMLLEKVRFSAIRGNVSEIKALTLGHSHAHGVDASGTDAQDPLEQTLALAHTLAQQRETVVAITGATDVVADATRAFVLGNGHPMMGQVTGTGCMLSALIGAYVSASPDQALEAAAAAVCAMGVCGELAYTRMGPRDGNGSYQTYLLDALCTLTGEELEEKANYEVR